MTAASPRTLLHVGCGGNPAPDWLSDYNEVRLDIDPTHKPDIVASMLDLGDIGPYDTVFSSHSLEHVYPHEVPIALEGFHRVLNDGGAAFIVVPDLEDIRPTEDVVYESAAGPVTGLDMYYGMARLIADNPYMAHKCGFTQTTLTKVLQDAGFSTVHVQRAEGHNLIGVAIK
jgi:predicted SAM-dependent methyltransferase